MVVWTSDICHFYDDSSSFSHAMYLLASKASGRWWSMDNPHIGSIGICDQSRLETQCFLYKWYHTPCYFYNDTCSCCHAMYLPVKILANCFVWTSSISVVMVSVIYRDMRSYVFFVQMIPYILSHLCWYISKMIQVDGFVCISDVFRSVQVILEHMIWLGWFIFLLPCHVLASHASSRGFCM